MMTALDKIQLVGAVAAIVIQVTATLLARPLKKVAPLRLWIYIMALNIFVLARRFLSLNEFQFSGHGDIYDNIAVFIGVGVSVFMLLTVLNLRKYLMREDANTISLAKATLLLAQDTATASKPEASGALKLAMALIAERTERNAVTSKDMENSPPTS
jgi:hypothetical protein